MLAKHGNFFRGLSLAGAIHNNQRQDNSQNISGGAVLMITKLRLSMQLYCLIDLFLFLKWRYGVCRFLEDGMSYSAVTDRIISCVWLGAAGESIFSLDLNILRM
jgi:hypothetical protein